MAKTRIELNSDGVRELLKSPEIQSHLEQCADAVIQSLGVGYEKSTHTGKNRVNVSVIATTNEAISENKKNNTVLKAIGAIGLSPKQK